MQRFLAIGNMTQIETLNKQVDQIQKLLRVRSELIGLVSSIWTCREMHIDIMTDKHVYTQNQSEQLLVGIHRKYKILQKAAHIAI